MKPFSYFLLLFFVIACSPHPQQARNETTPNAVKAVVKNNMIILDTPVWGYRFVIDGDFDGDGHSDTLYEHYFSRYYFSETNKYTSANDDIYDMAVAADTVKHVIAYMGCNGYKIASLMDCGDFGPLFIRNEGDLDGDGADEVGMVKCYAQMSSVNSYRVLSYRAGRWVEKVRFEIREWELPPLPHVGRVYGLFGGMGFYKVRDDSINNAIEKELHSFNQLLKKLPGNKVRIKTWSHEIDDSMPVLDLRHLPDSTSIGPFIGYRS